MKYTSYNRKNENLLNPLNEVIRLNPFKNLEDKNHVKSFYLLKDLHFIKTLGIESYNSTFDIIHLLHQVPIDEN